MKTLHFLGLILLESMLINLQAQSPKAPSRPATESFFGKNITDPFRNLEDLNDSSVMNWYKAQAAFTDAQLAKLPMRETILNELKELNSKLAYEIKLAPYVLPVFRGDKMFYIKTLANEQSGKLYYRQVETGGEILIFDPDQNNSTDISNVIAGFSVSDDGSKISVVVIRQGNEVGRLLIIDWKEKKQIESIERVKEPAAWLDEETFVYTQYHSSDVLNNRYRLNREAKKHVIGTPVNNDQIILSHENNPDIVPDSLKYPLVYLPHHNAKYLIGHVRSVDPFNDVYLSKILTTNSYSWYSLIKKQDQIAQFALQDTKVFGLSTKNNKNGKILMTSAEHPDWDHAKVIAEPSRGVINQSNPPFMLTKDYLYYVETYGVEKKIYRVKLSDLKKEEVKLPVTGNVFPVSLSPLESHLKMYELSWIHPPVIYDFDETKKSIRMPGFWLTSNVAGSDNMEVEIAYAVSHDSIKIPLTIIKPKGLKKDGSHRVILSGYGSYGTVMLPIFDPSVCVFANHDVITVIAHVRGGGEFGEQWRLGGFKSTKQNTWKDAIACAEYLIREGYTNPSKLAIMGKSAGGILAGRVMTERPDLFAVAIPQVGILNMLRFEFTPVGSAQIGEFGTIKKEEDFINLYNMDSYMHINDGTSYPATLVTGSLNDPRVIVWQPGKFAARLQAASSSGKPVWFRIDMHGGHGLAETKDQELKQTADILAFLLWQTPGKKE
ncbi:MAG TPA: prolyl oligopeptidase family serine peptidase [Chitinophagaceae bacterium]|nr:prolyl oligopeptidase family serine peptidase [Chitinophagaceae bacterium]